MTRSASEERFDVCGRLLLAAVLSGTPERHARPEVSAPYAPRPRVRCRPAAVGDASPMAASSLLDVARYRPGSLAYGSASGPAPPSDPMSRPCGPRLIGLWGFPCPRRASPASLRPGLGFGTSPLPSGTPGGRGRLGVKTRTYLTHLNSLKENRSTRGVALRRAC